MLADTQSTQRSFCCCCLCTSLFCRIWRSRGNVYPIATATWTAKVSKATPSDGCWSEPVFYLYSLSISVLLAVISLFVESIFFTLAFCLPIFQQTSTEKIELQVTRKSLSLLAKMDRRRDRYGLSSWFRTTGSLWRIGWLLLILLVFHLFIWPVVVLGTS